MKWRTAHVTKSSPLILLDSSHVSMCCLIKVAGQDPLPIFMRFFKLVYKITAGVEQGMEGEKYLSSED